MTVVTLYRRPMPPVTMTALDELVNAGAVGRFVPAPDLEQWVRDVFIADGGPLAFGHHRHLQDARVACLWTNVEMVKQGQRKIGQAEMPRPPTTADVWGRAKWEQQLCEWFGDVPDFTLTFDAVWATEADDRVWCSVVDHELMHCAQATDAYGEPKFNQRTGKPIYAVLGHPVEEFPDVVGRFGVQAAAGETVDLVISAAKPPSVTDAMVSQACGRAVPALKRRA
ncbi:MAG: putative metallopeptidase [Candidatus Zixiibacteriota bacterium]